MKKKIVVMGGGNTPSGDITIDDVVKFIHDDLKNFPFISFPYTTWNDIPDYKDANDGEVCKTNDSYDKVFNKLILDFSSYTIGVKGRLAD